MGGVTLGAVYGLVALGYSLIYSASGLMTFVQGEYFMLGAFVAWTLYVPLGLPFAAVLPLTVAALFVLGVLTERLLIGPLQRRGSGVIHIVLVTIGLSIFLRNAAMLGWGSELFHFPSVFGDQPFPVAGVYLVPQDLWIVGVALAGMGVLHLFLNHSGAGTALRAAAQDATGAAALGIDVPWSIALTWGFSAALAGAAGLLIAPIYGVQANMGLLIGLKGFAAAVVGGYGSIAGAVLGGLFLGLVETLAAGYVSSAAKDVIIFGVLLLVLFALPRGFLRVPVLD